MSTAYTIRKPRSGIEASGSMIDRRKRGDLRLRLPSGIGGTGALAASRASSGLRSHGLTIYSGRC